jgi:hypothetical protein
MSFQTEYGQSSRGGVNPIDAFRTVINTIRDDSLIACNRSNIEQGISRYNKASRDEDFSIQPGDLCVARKVDPTDGEYHKVAVVSSSLNGSFRKDVPAYKELERFEFAGYSLSVSNYGVNNATNKPNLACKRGGIHTVTNTGNLDIKMGDIILFAPADEDKPIPYERKNMTKIVWWIMPLKVDLDFFTRTSFLNALYDKQFREQSKYSKMVEATAIWKKAQFAQIVHSMHTLAMFGLIDLEFIERNDMETIFSEDEIFKRSRAYLDIDTQKKEDFFHIISKKLKLTHGEKSLLPKVPKTARIYGQRGKEIKISLEDALTQAVLGESEDFQLFNRDPVTKKIPGGFKGDILNAQLCAFEDMVKACNSIDHSVKRRAIGRSLSAAPPGGELDIELNPQY